MENFEFTHNFEGINFTIRVKEPDPLIPSEIYWIGKDCKIYWCWFRSEKGKWVSNGKVSNEFLQDPSYKDFICHSTLKNYKRNNP